MTYFNGDSISVLFDNGYKILKHQESADEKEIYTAKQDYSKIEERFFTFSFADWFKSPDLELYCLLHLKIETRNDKQRS